MATVELSAGRIELREVGPPDGRPVLFVHGFLVDSTLWADVPERLAAQGLRCLVPTLPLGAHTRAMRAGADLSPRGVARLLLDLLDRLGIEQAVLVGNDTGGGLCQLVLDLAPERVSALVLTDCDAFDTFPPFPFDWLFRAARHPGWGTRCCGRPGGARCGPRCSGSGRWPGGG
jgi:pimeloyl-ACP methyl ester carboxylesterase